MSTSTPRVTRAMAQNDLTIVLSEPGEDNLPKVKRKRLLEDIDQRKCAKPRQDITPPAPKYIELNELGVRFQKIKLSQEQMLLTIVLLRSKIMVKWSRGEYYAAILCLSQKPQAFNLYQNIDGLFYTVFDNQGNVKETVKSATTCTSDFAYLAQQPVLQGVTQKELISSIRWSVQELDKLDNTIQSIKTHIVTGAAMEEIRSICIEKLQRSLSEYTQIILEDVMNHKEFRELADTTQIFKHQMVTHISSTQFEKSSKICSTSGCKLGAKKRHITSQKISWNIENSKPSVALKQQIMQQRLDMSISMGMGDLSHHLDNREQDLQHRVKKWKQQISNWEESKSLLMAQSVQSKADELLRDSTLEMNNQECESLKDKIQTLQENVTSYESTMKYRGSQIQELNTKLDKLSLLVASRGTVHSRFLSNLPDMIRPADQWKELQTYATEVVHSTLESLSASPSNGNKGVSVSNICPLPSKKPAWLLPLLPRGNILAVVYYYSISNCDSECFVFLSFLDWIETQLTKIQDVIQWFPRRGNASGIRSLNEKNDKNAGDNTGGVEEEPMTEPHHHQDFRTPGQTAADERTSQGRQAPYKEADTTAIPSTSGSIRQNSITPNLVQRKKRTKRRINLDKEPSQRVSPRVERSDVERRVDHLLAKSLQNHFHCLSQEHRNKIPLLLYPSTQELPALIVLKEVDECNKLTEGSGLLGPHSRKLLTPEEVKQIGREEPKESEEQDNIAGFISNPGPDFLKTCCATAMRYGISHISWASECKKDPNLVDCIRWNRQIQALRWTPF
ncbi:uncharacterized protein MELLADRAFT_90910 [Melampsora larici-populina 98AG31]|uniref:Uncharacterized protein n=1 Tax=Melampsora larici-populina (strain 98AG31 / pathotype 3-4-7) TaxID=747676 RepID=F4R800_MELLP|nr:uncharacterized protein MELLADRAFT_90910 [Melampsora larici-populina 98AG31]EGG11407.1 hypothetical protein MELLADRAFT_90910 [Melampsora larici-populina 98AG31]